MTKLQLNIYLDLIENFPVFRFESNQCSTTGITKADIFTMLSVG